MYCVYLLLSYDVHVHVYMSDVVVNFHCVLLPVVS